MHTAVVFTAVSCGIWAVVASVMFVSPGGKDSAVCGACHMLLAVLCYLYHIMHCLCLIFCASGCCVNSFDCGIVKHVYGCMTSPVGHNAIHCCLRYRINVYDILNQNLDPGHVIWRHYQTCLMPELEVKSRILKEMLM